MTREERQALIESLQEKRAAKVAELREIIDTAKSESRDLTEDETTRYEAANAEVDSLGQNVEREQRQLDLDNELAEPTRRAPAPDPARKSPAVHTRENRDYSLTRLFRAQMTGDYRDAKIEVRASDEIRERTGREPDRGLFVPYRALLPIAKQRELEKRDVTAGTTGAALVGTDLIPAEFIELLRSEAKVVAAGGRVIPNLVGDVDFGRQTAGAVATWLATETTDLTTDTTFDTDTVSLSPKTVGIRADITRKSIKQSTPAVEDIVREDIRASIGLAVDAGAINGSGAAGQPQGIIGSTGVGAVDLTGGITWADVVELETDVGVANALRGRLAYMTGHALAGTMKTTPVDAGSGRFLMEMGGSISALAGGQSVNGYPAHLTEQVPAAQILFGNWAEVLLGMWGVLDLFADPYTLGDRGGLVVRGFQDMDVALRHGASFSHGS